MGLSITFFAIMMTSVIGSLILIIFSFNLPIIVSTIIFNILLFSALTYCNNNPQIFHLKKVLPNTISNKRESFLDYEED